jgi:hypothetical protein
MNEPYSHRFLHRHMRSLSLSLFSPFCVYECLADERFHVAIEIVSFPSARVTRWICFVLFRDKHDRCTQSEANLQRPVTSLVESLLRSRTYRERERRVRKRSLEEISFLRESQAWLSSSVPAEREGENMCMHSSHS